MDEFDIIATYFKKSGKRKDVLLGIGDDCAILRPPADKQLLVSTDTLNQGVHFFPNTAPFDIGFKSVAVSLSDIAAMGGEPAWLLLSLTLPYADKDWLENFSNGVFSCMQPFNIDLVGGNLSKGPLAVTTQIMGFVSEESKLTRDNAKVGDLIYVTGTLGDAGLALGILKNEINTAPFSMEEIDNLIERLWRPNPRIREAQTICQWTSAAIDISDGLLADLNHILIASQVGAEVDIEKIPHSSSLAKMENKQRQELLLNTGDDYELCVTVPPRHVAQVENLMQQHSCPFTCIGKIVSNPGLKIIGKDGRLLDFSTKGYQHFEDKHG